jgi:hypothetical protein
MFTTRTRIGFTGPDSPHQEEDAAMKRSHKSHRGARRGMALMFTLFAVLVIAGAVLTLGAIVFTEKSQTDFAVNRAVLDEACQAGIDIAVERVWNQYRETLGNTTGNLASYLVFINNLVENNEDLNFNGVMDGNEFDFNGNGQFDIGEPTFLFTEGDPYTLPSGARIVQLRLDRTDDLTGTTITVTSMAEYAGERRAAEQTVRIGGELFDGFEYGILANNINCILCHAKFHSLEMDLWRNDPTMHGEHDRIKVAALESLMIRTNENINSRVAGTIYTRGEVYNQNGNQLSANQIANSTLRGWEFDPNNGKLYQDHNGNLNTVSLNAASVDGDGRPEQFANLYMNYPTDKTLMTDGSLPEKFPAPFPDENENRIVDDEEFNKVVNASNGSITFQGDPDASGSIQAGVAYGVPHGAAFDGNSLPTTSNGALASLESDGSYDGNLILVGTNDDPIVIDRRVSVNGDLVISGKVRGWGQLLVRGNVYVVGDVTYDDAPGEFGLAADGTRNGLALSAGGSIMMGDYLTTRGKMNPSNNAKYPAGGFIDMRQQNRTSTVQGHQVQHGYFDEGVYDIGYPQDTVDGFQPQFSFTTSELMLFNEMEYQRAQSNPSYEPRYYRLNPNAPVYRYVANDEHATRYSEAGVIAFDPGPGAVIHDISPNNWWMSDDQLRQIWWEDEMTRPQSGRPFQFDGLLYSNNSIFGIVRSKGRHNSNTYGEMIIRGSIVASDLGMLVPGRDFSANRDALDLFYDRRVADFLTVEDTTQVQFRRLAFNWVSPNTVVN